MLVTMSRRAYCLMTACASGCGVDSVADGLKKKLREAGTSTRIWSRKASLVELTIP